MPLIPSPLIPSPLISSPLIPWLKRGSVELRLLAGPHPLDEQYAQSIAEIWHLEQQRRGTGLHDGSILALEAWTEHAGRIVCQVRRRPYRSYLARHRDPTLDLRCSPLGVTGITVFPDGRWLMGKRAPQVTAGPGKWEAVPAGALDPELCLSNGQFDVRRQLFTELREETGLNEQQAGIVDEVGLVYDPADDVYDVLFRLQPAVANTWLPAATAEHTVFAACQPGGVALLGAIGSGLPSLSLLTDTR